MTIFCCFFSKLTLMIDICIIKLTIVKICEFQFFSICHHRAKRNAEKTAEAQNLQFSIPTAPERRMTRAVVLTSETAIAAKRKKATEQKRKERLNWTAQKWRRHREKNLAAYYARKSKKSSFNGTGLCTLFVLHNVNCDLIIKNVANTEGTNFIYI